MYEMGVGFGVDGNRPCLVRMYVLIIEELRGIVYWPMNWHSSTGYPLVVMNILM